MSKDKTASLRGQLEILEALLKKTTMELRESHKRIFFLEEANHKEKRSNKRKSAELRRNRTDRLTGAHSDVAYSKDFPRKRAEFARHGGGVMFIDLNNLKIANDRFGHSTGDKLLKKLAEVAMRLNTTQGRVYRHKGDEFLNLIPRARYQTVNKIATAIKEEFDAYCDQHYNHMIDLHEERIGVSIGCAEGKDIRAVIDRADGRMYDRKFEEKGIPPR
jgi:diguanylate cyclase (GGDEF)-like protein